MADRVFDWKAPPDDEHVQKYPLSRSMAEAMSPTPIAIGVNWYAAFDRPERDKYGRYWVARSGNLGRLRGGHCVCLKPREVEDSMSWYRFYDQGSEGACVGFGVSRIMSLINRRKYFARWLWDRAKETDIWPETNPGDSEGTSVRAAMDILRHSGHVPWRPSLTSLNDEPSDAVGRARLVANPSHGIRVYRWIRSMDDMLQVLGYQDREYVDILNSWGPDYPHLVRVPVSVMARLWNEDGEFGVPTPW